MAFEFVNYRRAETWEIAPHNRTAGASIQGTQQVVGTLADQWTAELHILIPLEQLAPLRAWRTRRRGRLVTDTMGPKRDLAGSADGVVFGEEVLYSDGAAHSDGAGFSQGYTVTAGAALRATRLTFESSDIVGSFDAGYFFGLAGRLYQITRRGTESATSVTVDFWPPLRVAIGAGAGLDWPPLTTMRLASDDTGLIDNARHRGAIETTFSMQEVL